MLNPLFVGFDNNSNTNKYKPFIGPHLKVACRTVLEVLNYDLYHL